LIGNTRDRIVELGRDYIQLEGYHTFRYQQIASQLNIKNAAIHYYFPNKEELGVAAIERDRDDFRQMTKLLETSSALEKAEALLTIYRDYQRNTKKICVIGVCGSDFNDLPVPMQRATQQYLEHMISWLTTVFEQGLEAGEFTFSGRAEDLAAHWAATLIGSLQMARVIPDYFDANHNLLRESLHQD
jgi:TetR/AcrR family transcriptional repressor of nem operon